MKTKIMSVIWAAAAALAAVCVNNVQAQSTNAPTEQNFFQTAEGYLTSFNPDYTWSGVAIEASVGADYQSGLQWANDLELQYDLPGTNSILGNVGVGYRMRNAGIAGVVEMNEAKLEYAIKSYEDTRVEASIYLGYDNQYDCAVVEPQIGIRKKLTANTFAGIYLSEPILTRRIPNNKNQWVPNVGIETGFTF